MPLPAGLHPRGLSADEAAEYCGVSETTLYAEIRKGRLPRPVRFGVKDGSPRWDRLAIDKAWDSLSGLSSEPASPEEEALRRTHDRRSSIRNGKAKQG